MTRVLRPSVLTAVLLAALLGLVACSVPQDGDARALDQRTVDAALNPAAPATSVPIGNVPVAIYFVADSRNGAKGPFLVPVQRDAMPPGGPAEALATLLSSRPDRNDRDQGFKTLIPEETRLVGVTRDALGRYEVSLTTFKLKGPQLTGALGQMVFTLSHDDPTAEVRFRVDGQPFPAQTSDEANPKKADEYVTRDDYRPLAVPPTTTTTAAPATTATPATPTPATTTSAPASAPAPATPAGR